MVDGQYGYCMKWTYHVAYPQAIKRVANDAWRDSQAYPGGPVGIEFPLWTLATDIEKSWPITPSHWQRHNAYMENWRGASTGERFPGAAGNLEAVESALKKIMAAKRPIMMGGDGVNFAEADHLVRCKLVSRRCAAADFICSRYAKRRSDMLPTSVDQSLAARTIGGNP